MMLIGFVASLAHAAPGDKPARIVSLNLCTDQIVMMLVTPDRIAGISHLSRDPDASVMAAMAETLPITRGLAEDILTLKPDLVIAGTYTTRPTIALLKALRYPVLEVAPAFSIAAIRRNVRRIAAAVGERAKGEALIAAFDARLASFAAAPPGRALVAATYYAANYTSGSATLADDIIRAAGFRNLARDMGKRGAGRLALEDLIVLRPDLIILGRTRQRYNSVTSENLRHPAFKALLGTVPSVTIPDKLWVCGTPRTLDAVAALVAARRRVLGKVGRR